MHLLIVILLIVICVCSALIFLIVKKDLLNSKKHYKKNTKNLVKDSTPIQKVKPIISSKDDVEVLELYPKNKKSVVTDISDDTLNLNELFKTISMEAISDDTGFDFGLRREEKK